MHKNSILPAPAPPSSAARPADMALTPAVCSTAYAQLVGNTFVGQYYSILQARPEIVFRLYEESSCVSRPDSNGVMRLVTTTKAINDMLMDYYKGCTLTVATVDSQLSYNEGVFVFVTGFLSELEKAERKFCQTFFLAYRGIGNYFVLNDILRFTDETQPVVLAIRSTSDVSEAPVVPDLESQEVACVQDFELRDSAKPPSERLPKSDEEVNCYSKNGDEVGEQGFSVPASDEHRSLPVTEVTHSGEQSDLPKVSYVSIVKLKGSSLPAQISAPGTKERPAGSIPEKPVTGPRKTLTALTKVAPATEASATGITSVPHKDDSLDVVGYSVYIKNLPITATAEQVETEFKIFGPIITGGVQVKRQQAGHKCFGFVEFESKKSMQNAIMASPIIFEGCPAFVEEKRTAIRVRNGVIVSGLSARDAPGTGGYRNYNSKENWGSFRNSGFERSNYRHQGSNSASDRVQNYRPRNLQNGVGNSGIERRYYRNAPDRVQNYGWSCFRNDGWNDDRNTTAHVQNYELRDFHNGVGNSRNFHNRVGQSRKFQNGVGNNAGSDYRNNSSNATHDRV